MEQHEQIESTTEIYFTTARYYNVDQCSDLWVNSASRHHYTGHLGYQKAKQLARDQNDVIADGGNPYFVIRVVKTTNVERV